MNVPEILELLRTESFQHNLNAIEFRKRLLELEVKTNTLIEQHPGMNYIGQTQQITELIIYFRARRLPPSGGRGIAHSF